MKKTTTFLKTQLLAVLMLVLAVQAQPNEIENALAVDPETEIGTTKSACASLGKTLQKSLFPKSRAVYAGSDATICQDNSYTIQDASASNYTSLLWTTGGDGTFDDPTTLNPVYTPGIDDIINQYVELCLAADAETDCMELSIQQNAYVDIISDEMTICYGEAVDFTGLVVAGNYNQILWYTTNGCGMFSDETVLNTTYMPSPMDYIIFEQTGMCTQLVVFVSPINPCVVYGSDEVYVCYQAQPEVITGPDTTITEGNSFNINGASAENYGTLLWSTSGDGYFDDNTILYPTYYFGNNDISNGTAELCLYANPVAPCADAEEDCMTLTIDITTATNELTLNPGWTGISSYLDPVNPDIVQLMALIQENLLIIQNINGQYYQPEGNNTLINWDYLDGYFIKTSEATTLDISGFEPASTSITLTTGWNLMPVLSAGDVEIQELFAGQTEKVLIIKDAVGVDVFWPGKQIFFLSTLIPGKAYMVKMSEEATVTF
ncbi:MAG: hypothetical protein B6D64_09420 [Bacteroidetes bacterium 4484_276]|nr:MAG: hypothetical protein B6D64_09420 [Bacteroidetes bacterium 4484_276]